MVVRRPTVRLCRRPGAYGGRHHGAGHQLDLARWPRRICRVRECRRVAGHLAEQYERVGLENAQVIETGGHPVVYADWLKAPNKPPVLLYGHYDVQPVDPLDLWTSPPFEPIRQDGQLLGRGSSDDKGQIALHWQAIQARLNSTGELPLNLKVIAEGEE